MPKITLFSIVGKNSLALVAVTLSFTLAIIIFHAVLRVYETGNEGPIATIRKILPHKAWVVYTQANWGQIREQRILFDATDLVERDDGRYVEIKEIQNPRDVQNRDELYVSFPAEEMTEASGFYVFRFAPGKKMLVNGSCKLDHIYLESDGKEYAMVVKAKFNTPIEVQLFYSRNPELEEGWTQMGRTTRPRKTMLLRIYSVKDSDILIARFPSKRTFWSWKIVRLPIKPLFLREGLRLDIAEQLLEKLKALGDSDNPYLFYEKNITAEKIRQILNQFSAVTSSNNQQYILDATIEYYIQDQRGYQELVRVGSEELIAPHLRQTVAVRNTRDNLLLGEVVIRVEIATSRDGVLYIE